MKNTSEYTFTIDLKNRKYTSPKLSIPKISVNGKKVATIAQGKRWYVYFRYNGKLYKYYKRLNEFKTIAERRKLGNALAEIYAEMLNRGWSPINENGSAQKIQTNTLQEALKIALDHKKSTLKQSPITSIKLPTIVLCNGVRKK